MCAGACLQTHIGRIVFGAWDTNLYALDADTLELRWKWNNGKSQILYSPGNVNPVIAGGQAIIVAPDRFMTAIDLKTGKTIWRSNAYKVRESLGRSVDGSTVYAKTMDGELIAVETGRPEFTLKWVCDLKFGYDHAPCPVLEHDGSMGAGVSDGEGHRYPEEVWIRLYENGLQRHNRCRMRRGRIPGRRSAPEYGCGKSPRYDHCCATDLPGCK